MPMLPVPYIGQWGIAANRYRTDCGVACVAMCLEYYGIRGGLTVDTLAAETPLSSSDNGLPCSALVNLAGRHGLHARSCAGVALDDLRREIDALRPVIVLVSYGYITGRLDQGYIGLHFFIVVGYDDTHFICNDPDFWNPHQERGHDILIPISELDRAMAVCGGQAVFMEQPMSIPDQISAYADQIKTLAGQIDEIPLPPAGTTMYTTAALNMRDQPSTVTGKVVGTLLKGDKIQVEDAPNATGWKRIVYGPFLGNFVSAGYLSANPT